MTNPFRFVMFNKVNQISHYSLKSLELYEMVLLTLENFERSSSTVNSIT